MKLLILWQREWYLHWVPPKFLSTTVPLFVLLLTILGLILPTPPTTFSLPWVAFLMTTLTTTEKVWQEDFRSGFIAHCLPAGIRMKDFVVLKMSQNTFQIFILGLLTVPLSAFFLGGSFESITDIGLTICVSSPLLGITNTWASAILLLNTTTNFYFASLLLIPLWLPILLTSFLFMTSGQASFLFMLVGLFLLLLPITFYLTTYILKEALFR